MSLHPALSRSTPPPTGAHVVQLRPDMAPTAAAPQPAAPRRLDIFGLRITDTSLAAAVQLIVSRAILAQATTIGFINAHCVNTLYRDQTYRNSLGSLDVLFADGSGMRVAARAAGRELIDNVNGTDLFPLLCREAATRNVSIYLLGANVGVAGDAAKRMVGDIPELSIAGTRSGYFADAADEQGAIDEINASGADIVLVGMGVPLQEKWIVRNRARLRPSVIVGVGGLFDYYSGRIARAPLPLRKLGLEWTWRLAMEPRRLARRYLLGNVEFMARLACLRLLAPVEVRQARQR